MGGIMTGELQSLLATNFNKVIRSASVSEMRHFDNDKLSDDCSKIKNLPMRCFSSVGWWKMPFPNGFDPALHTMGQGHAKRPRKQQYNWERVHAGNTDQRYGGDQLTNASNSGQAEAYSRKTGMHNVSQLEEATLASA